MNLAQIKKLQKAVGVHDDGIIGRGTLTAVFKKIKVPVKRVLKNLVLLLMFTCEPLVFWTTHFALSTSLHN